MVGKAIVRQALEPRFSWLVVEFAVDLRKRHLAISIFPIAPTKSINNTGHREFYSKPWNKDLGFIPELKILASGEAHHDRESTTSPPSTTPVLSQNLWLPLHERQHDEVLVWPSTADAQEAGCRDSSTG